MVRQGTLTPSLAGSSPAIPASRPRRPSLIFDPVAQSVEQLPFKPWVRGSSPRWVTNSKIPAAPPLPAEPRAALLPDSGFTVLHQTITSQKNLRKKARRPAVPSSALNFPAKIPPSTAPQLKAPPHPEPPAPRTGHSGYPAPGTAPPIQLRPPGDRARRHRKGWGSRRPCAPGGTAGAVCP